MTLMLYLAMIETEEDKCKFEIVYEKNKERMYRVAMGILHNHEDAEDALQEALTSIAKNMVKIGDPLCRKTTGYVVKVVSNKAKDIRAHRYRVRALDGDSYLERQTDSHRSNIEVFVEGEGAAYILDQIGERNYEMIFMKLYMGHTIEEISQMFDISVSNAYKTIERTMKKVKELIQEEEEKHK